MFREPLECLATIRSRLIGSVLLLISGFVSLGAAQEMEPRAYSRAPVGSQFIVFSTAFQTGDVLTDAALPLTDVSGVINGDRQANSRLGGTFSFPVSQRQSIKVAFARGLTTRFGGDMTTVVVAWQYAWVNKSQ